MIQANELRIGNWVEYPLIGYAQIRTGADIDNVFEDAGNAIDLSPEILDKVGFVNCTCGGKKVKFLHLSKGKEFYYYKTIDIKHLHQLQNLYFALTGEELNIQL